MKNWDRISKVQCHIFVTMVSALYTQENTQSQSHPLANTSFRERSVSKINIELCNSRHLTFGLHMYALHMYPYAHVCTHTHSHAHRHTLKKFVFKRTNGIAKVFWLWVPHYIGKHSLFYSLCCDLIPLYTIPAAFLYAYLGSEVSKLWSYGLTGPTPIFVWSMD